MWNMITEEEIKIIRAGARIYSIQNPDGMSDIQLMEATKNLRKLAKEHPLIPKELASGYKVSFSYDQMIGAPGLFAHLSISHVDNKKYDHAEADMIAEKLLGAGLYIIKAHQFRIGAGFHYVKRCLYLASHRY